MPTIAVEAGAMLTIWGRPNSHNVKKVLWFVEEIGLPHRRIDMGGPFGFTPDYLAMNPNRLIPTIEEENGFALWESNAILRYLAARHAPAFWPDDPAARARGDKWMDWQMTFAEVQRDAFLELVRVPEAERDTALIARSAEASGEMMRILEAALGDSPWLSGERFGLGDIPMGVYAHTFFTLDVPRPDLPRLADWYARLKARPGYAAHVMIPLT